MSNVAHDTLHMTKFEVRFEFLAEKIGLCDSKLAVNVGSKGKEHFHRPLRIGPNLSRLRCIPMALPLFYFEPRSFSAIVIQVLFSSWCWGSSRG